VRQHFTVEARGIPKKHCFRNLETLHSPTRKTADVGWL